MGRAPQCLLSARIGPGTPARGRGLAAPAQSPPSPRHPARATRRRGRRSIGRCSGCLALPAAPARVQPRLTQPARRPSSSRRRAAPRAALRERARRPAGEAPEAERPDWKMNNLSFSELCCLFCCPPCPGKIASKLAFLPPDPTYTLMCDESGSRWTLHLSERADWQYSSREKDAIECFMTRTSKGNRIACMFVRCSPNAKYTLLFSHGNAVDLGQMSSFYIGLGSRINCNIFSYDYSGYGASSGKPTEKNLYADIDAAWVALRTRYGIRPENVIIYGQSIGTVPSVDLAARYESAAVILHSPLTSGMRVAFPDTKKTYCFDAFPNIDKISKITSPVLIIHGTEDEVIDFSHGLALFERCQRPVEPLWVEGAGHNDVELYGQYLERLKQFVSQELVNL
ncbi:Hydrolase_4 domain-containing protein [Podarcis lilfordi]|nr:Hydrolase_4 domain-containing protein [Podarcis lilfordi]